jgi:hypothetical protein
MHFQNTYEYNRIYMSMKMCLPLPFSTTFPDKHNLFSLSLPGIKTRQTPTPNTTKAATYAITHKRRERVVN